MSKSLSATTPQLKAVDRFYEAYRTRDLKNAEPFMSKNFIYKTLPKSAKVPDLAKAEYLEKFGPMFASLAKLEHIFHQVIEAPGKVVIHWTSVVTPPNGVTVEREILGTITLVEEDGEIKVLEQENMIDSQVHAIEHRVLLNEGQTSA